MSHRYGVSFPRAYVSIGCPVGACEGQATMRTNLRIHFLNFHMRDTIVIMEEGNLPHTCFLECDIFIPWAALNRHHHNISLCALGA